MIREMCEKDWDSMKNIYKQSLQKGNVTFTTDCPTYEEWDAEHIKSADLYMR
jgi:phosphinothricin acetyltransferase